MQKVSNLKNIEHGRAGKFYKIFKELLDKNKLGDDIGSDIWKSLTNSFSKTMQLEKHLEEDLVFTLSQVYETLGKIKRKESIEFLSKEYKGPLRKQIYHIQKKGILAMLKRSDDILHSYRNAIDGIFIDIARIEKGELKDFDQEIYFVSVSKTKDEFQRQVVLERVRCVSFQLQIELEKFEKVKNKLIGQYNVYNNIIDYGE